MSAAWWEARKVGESYSDMLRSVSDEVLLEVVRSSLLSIQASGLESAADEVSELARRYFDNVVRREWTP